MTEFMFAETIGIVAPVASSGASDTSSLLVTADLPGTRKTSE